VLFSRLLNSLDVSSSNEFFTTIFAYSDCRKFDEALSVINKAFMSSSVSVYELFSDFAKVDNSLRAVSVNRADLDRIFNACLLSCFTFAGESFTFNHGGKKIF